MHRSCRCAMLFVRHRGGIEIVDLVVPVLGSWIHFFLVKARLGNSTPLLTISTRHQDSYREQATIRWQLMLPLPPARLPTRCVS